MRVQSRPTPIFCSSSSKTNKIKNIATLIKLTFVEIMVALSMCNKLLNLLVTLEDEFCLVRISVNYTHKIHKRKKNKVLVFS